MDQAVVDQVVAQVVDAVIKKMIGSAPRQRVLMVFSGASAGYVAGMDAIQALSQGRHELTVVMTASAAHVIGEAHVRKAGATHIIGAGEWAHAPRMIHDTDLLLMPTLSINTAARLALGLMDSLVSTLVLGALLAGKPVLAICDGANPYGNGGRVFGEDHDIAPALRARLADNLTTLMGYGVHLVTQDEFLPALARHLYQAHRVESPAEMVAPPPARESKSMITNTIVTAGDLAGYRGGETLRLSAGTRLTPLAQDTARRLALRLVVG